jgi:hypothetical protein
MCPKMRESPSSHADLQNLNQTKLTRLLHAIESIWMNYYVQVELLAKMQGQQFGHDSFLCYTINNVFREEATFPRLVPQGYILMFIFSALIQGESVLSEQCITN